MLQTTALVGGLSGVAQGAGRGDLLGIVSGALQTMGTVAGRLADAGGLTPETAALARQVSRGAGWASVGVGAGRAIAGGDLSAGLLASLTVLAQELAPKIAPETLGYATPGQAAGPAPATQEKAQEALPKTETTPGPAPTPGAGVAPAPGPAPGQQNANAILGGIDQRAGAGRDATTGWQVAGAGNATASDAASGPDGGSPVPGDAATKVDALRARYAEVQAEMERLDTGGNTSPEARESYWQLKNEALVIETNVRATLNARFTGTGYHEPGDLEGYLRGLANSAPGSQPGGYGSMSVEDRWLYIKNQAPAYESARTAEAGRLYGDAVGGPAGAAIGEFVVGIAGGVGGGRGGKGGGVGGLVVGPTGTRTFSTSNQFNTAANSPEPNVTYKSGTYSWVTDANGRSAGVSGQVEVKSYGRDVSLQTQIGKEGVNTDVGFHLIGDALNGPTNRLNVVPGNGKPFGDEPNLNQGAYKKFENQVRTLAADPANRVEIKVEPVYDPGNMTTRPDQIIGSYRVNGGDWVIQQFSNKSK